MKTHLDNIDNLDMIGSNYFRLIGDPSMSIMSTLST